MRKCVCGVLGSISFSFSLFMDNFLKDRDKRNMIFPPFPLQEIIEIDDHFRRFYSDDDNLNKAVSFSEGTVGDMIILVKSIKKMKWIYHK